MAMVREPLFIVRTPRFAEIQVKQVSDLLTLVDGTRTVPGTHVAASRLLHVWARLFKVFN